MAEISSDLMTATVQCYLRKVFHASLYIIQHRPILVYYSRNFFISQTGVWLAEG